jgi:hypothetical protein
LQPNNLNSQDPSDRLTLTNQLPKDTAVDVEIISVLESVNLLLVEKIYSNRDILVLSNCNRKREQIDRWIQELYLDEKGC